MNQFLKFEPILKEKIWGGKKLASLGKYLKSENSIRQWESVLNKMEEKFETKDWERLVIDMNLSRETAFNWLRELQTIGMIKKVKHGHYMKTEMKILRNVE